MPHGGHNKKQGANLQLAPITQSGAATMLNVSERSIATAKKVNEGTPKLVKAVELEKIASEAAKISLYTGFSRALCRLRCGKPNYDVLRCLR